MIITAVNANSNWDGSKDAREAKFERIMTIQRWCKEAIEFLYSDKTEIEREPDVMEADPLFRPLRNMASSLKAEVSRPVAAEEGAGAALVG